MVELKEITHRYDGIYVTFKVTPEEMNKEVGYDIEYIFSKTPEKMAIRFLKQLVEKTVQDLESDNCFKGSD